jgi:FMN reductase
MNEHRPTIVGLGGSLRKGSSSEQALLEALQRARARGGETLGFAGQDLAFPLYNPQPGGAGLSSEASRFIQALRSADGLILASPCYHGGICGLLKNAIDYVEEMRTDERVYFDGLPVGCVGCGFGWQGPNLVISNLRSIVHSLRGWPTPLGVAINTAVTKFDDDGCSDAAVSRQLDIMAGQIIDFASLRLREQKRAA